MFRRATKDDYQAIKTLSDAIWGNDERAKANRPEGWNRRGWTVRNHMPSDNTPGPTTLVGEVHGRVVAAGSIVVQEPRDHIYLHVAPGFRDRGLGEALFEALDSAHAARSYMTREYGDPELVDMYESLGFQAVLRVTEGRIDPEEPATGAWIDGVMAAPTDDLSVVAIDAQELVTPIEVARLFDRVFKKTDSWAATFPHSDARALELFVSHGDERVMPTCCAFVGGRLVGAASLGEPWGPPFEEDPGAHLGWLAVEDAGLIDANNVAEALVAHGLDTARQQGLDVHIEAPKEHPLLHACVWAIPGADLEEGLTVLITDPPERR